VQFFYAQYSDETLKNCNFRPLAHFDYYLIDAVSPLGALRSTHGLTLGRACGERGTTDGNFISPTENLLRNRFFTPANSLLLHEYMFTKTSQYCHLEGKQMDLF